ncbi:MAG: hypothetical protein WCF23_22715 [Candidatus Nitrosopolaris sp.]
MSGNIDDAHIKETKEYLQYRKKSLSRIENNHSVLHATLLVNVCAIKQRVLLITVAIVLAHMQEGLEDNNLISIREHIQSVSAADARLERS